MYLVFKWVYGGALAVHWRIATTLQTYRKIFKRQRLRLPCVACGCYEKGMQWLRKRLTVDTKVACGCPEIWHAVTAKAVCGCYEKGIFQPNAVRMHCQDGEKYSKKAVKQTNCEH